MCNTFINKCLLGGRFSILGKTGVKLIYFVPCYTCNLTGHSTDKVEIEETTTLKDLDLDFVFYIEPSHHQTLITQMERECKFLEFERIMEYSLLLGVHL